MANLPVSDYLSNRLHALPEADRTELNARLDAVATRFGVQWLALDHGNPVQALWSRKDADSTNELLLLGDAIVNLSAADTAWVTRQIDDIKGGDAGTRAGALFELLGLNLFSQAGQRVVPAPAGNPGYDASVVFGDGSSLMLSIKNHGISRRESDFRVSAEQAKDVFVAACEARRQRAFLRIATTKYPTEADWDRLRNDIPTSFKKKYQRARIFGPVRFRTSRLSFTR